MLTQSYLIIFFFWIPLTLTLTSVLFWILLSFKENKVPKKLSVSVLCELNQNIIVVSNCRPCQLQGKTTKDVDYFGCKMHQNAGNWIYYFLNVLWGGPPHPPAKKCLPHITKSCWHPCINLYTFLNPTELQSPTSPGTYVPYTSSLIALATFPGLKSLIIFYSFLFGQLDILMNIDASCLPSFESIRLTITRVDTIKRKGSLGEEV